MKARKTPLQKEYQKQLSRIKRYISSKEKQGFLIPESVLPKVPKKITRRSVEALKKKTPEKILSKAEYVSDLTYGEIVPAKKGIELIKKQGIEKAKETRRRKKEQEKEWLEPEIPFFSDIVINNFKLRVMEFNQECQRIIFSWLDALLSTQSREGVAEMLENGAKNGLIITYKIAYDRTRIAGFISAMLEYLPDFGLLQKQEFMDAFEEDQELLVE